MTVQEAAGVLMRALDAGDVPMVATSREPAALVALQRGSPRDHLYGAVFQVLTEDGSRFCVEVSRRSPPASVRWPSVARGAR